MMPVCSSDSSKLALGTHHAVAFDASDLADRESGIDARNIGAGRSEGADQAGARIRRAADDLHQLAVAGIHGKHLQLIRIGVPLSCQNPGDHEGLEARFIVNGLHFETDGGQPLDDFVKRRVGLQMVLQPGEGEFHVRVPVTPTSASDGSFSGRASVGLAPFAAAAYSPSGSTSRIVRRPVPCRARTRRCARNTPDALRASRPKYQILRLHRGRRLHRPHRNAG